MYFRHAVKICSMPPQIPFFGGSIPDNYDRHMGPWIFEPYAVEVAARIAREPPAQILEIACGTGRVTANLQKSLPEAEITATDFNPEMMAVARRRVPNGSIHWQTADGQHLPFGNGSFDAVICQFGLMFMPDPPLALREMWRVLRTAGRVVFSTWDRLEGNPAFLLANDLVAEYFPAEPPRFFYQPFSLYGDDILLGLAREAGFREIRVSLVPMIGEAESAASVASGVLEGSPMYDAILSRDASLLPVMLEALEKKLRDAYGDRPFRSPMQAWIVEGVK